MRNQIIEALKAHAHGHVEKHRLNVEVYLSNPVGIGEHSDVMDAIEIELAEMAKYQDQLDLVEKYFKKY